MSFSSALLCWLPTFITKREAEIDRSTSTALAGPRQVSAPVVASHQVSAPGDTPRSDPTAGVGNPRQAATLKKADVVPPDYGAQGASRHASPALEQSSRPIEEEIGPLSFAHHYNPNTPPERYALIKFLSYDEIAAEFVSWLQSSPRMAYLRGWPITVDEVWKMAYQIFQRETLIAIQSRQNFFTALGKHPEVKRERNRRVRSDDPDRRWEKTTVYRFLTADQIAAQAKIKCLRRTA